MFGYELLEIDNKLMLYNLIENNKSPYLEFDNLQPRYVVLFFTLLYIFMAGGTAPEGKSSNIKNTIENGSSTLPLEILEQIWNFFRNLGLLRNNQFKTEEYGDLNDLILNVSEILIVNFDFNPKNIYLMYFRSLLRINTSLNQNLRILM